METVVFDSYKHLKKFMDEVTTFDHLKIVDFRADGKLVVTIFYKSNDRTDFV